MNRRNILSLSAITALGVAVLPGSAVAQQKSLKEQLVGTWTLVSYDSVAADNSHKPSFGSKPSGILVFDGGGKYVLVLTNSARPKWKSQGRLDATADEWKSAGLGTVAQFGKWSVDEGNKTLIRLPEGALNPNSPGVEARTTIAVSGDELRMTDPNSGVVGGKTEQTYRRAK
jgi:hypothetical protein